MVQNAVQYAIYELRMFWVKCLNKSTIAVGRLWTGLYEGSPETITSADTGRRFAVVHDPAVIVAVILTDSDEGDEEISKISSWFISSSIKVINKFKNKLGCRLCIQITYNVMRSGGDRYATFQVVCLSVVFGE